MNGKGSHCIAKCNQYDLIVIGSGVSAMYFGYKYPKNKRILFITKDSDVGGRIMSIDSQPGTPYKCEMCALRYYPDIQLEMKKLVEELGIETVTFEGSDIPTVTPVYPEIMEKVEERYPRSEVSNNKKLTLNAAMTLTSSIVDARKYFTGDGYWNYYTGPLSLYFWYNEIPFSNQKESRLVNGMETLVKELYERIKNKYHFKFNTEVVKVKKCRKCKRFIVNDKWLAKRVVYTGTKSQFSRLNMEGMQSVIDRRNLFNEYMFPQNSLKMFLYVEKPWWNSRRWKYATESAAQQLFYYSDNIIYIYSMGVLSNALRYITPLGRYSREGWIDSSKFPELIGYMKEEIPKILSQAVNEEDRLNPTEEQVESITKVAFSYQDQAYLLQMPISDELSNGYFDNVISGRHDGFWYLSGDLSPISGWIDSDLVTVNGYVDEI